MDRAATFEPEMTRHIRAPRERVFDAFTDQAALAVWHCPRGMGVVEARADARVGGQYRIVMGGRDGSKHIAAGEYQSLDRANFLAYTWWWEAGSMPPELKTLIEVTLTDKDGGTDLHMRHTGFPDTQTRDGHMGGWQSVFNRLNDYLDPEGTAGTVTVYGNPRSTYCRTVRMALAEKGVPYTLVTGLPQGNQHIENALATPLSVMVSETIERFDAVFTGAGDTLSATVAGLLAMGDDLEASVAEAFSYLDGALDAGFRPGMGHALADRLFWAQAPDDADDSDEHTSSEDFLPGHDTRH